MTSKPRMTFFTAIKTTSLINRDIRIKLGNGSSMALHNSVLNFRASDSGCHMKADGISIIIRIPFSTRYLVFRL
jgi:hypothetical protein